MAKATKPIRKTTSSPRSSRGRSTTSQKGIRIREIEAKSILQKSGLPDTDWVINPYLGCRFGCKYCYAAFMGRFGHKGEEWGSFVDVKANAPSLLRDQLERKLARRKKKDLGSIFFSSVTDPYQGLEAKYKLTRQCLQVLVDLGYTGKVSILTKSALITRDIELLKKLKNVEVGMTVTSMGDPVSKYLETYATPNGDRLAALRLLNASGISTYAFIGPLLPHQVWMEEEMRELIIALKNTGVSYVYMEHLNLAPYIRDRLFEYLNKDYPQLLVKYREADTKEYREKLDRLVKNLLKESELPLAHEMVIHHRDKNSWKKLKK